MSHPRRPQFAALQVRVLEAESRVVPSLGYRLARLLVASSALAHFAFFVILVPAARLREFTESHRENSSLVLGAFVLTLLSAVWGCFGAVQIWFRGRLLVASRLQRLGTRVEPALSDRLILSDVAAALAALPRAPRVFGWLIAQRRRDEELAREVDGRLRRGGGLGVRFARSLVEWLRVLGVGSAAMAGFLGAYPLATRVPDAWLRGLGDAERLVLLFVGAVALACSLGFAADQVLLVLWRRALRRMLFRVRCGPAPR